VPCCCCRKSKIRPTYSSFGEVEAQTKAFANRRLLVEAVPRAMQETEEVPEWRWVAVVTGRGGSASGGGGGGGRAFGGEGWPMVKPAPKAMQRQKRSPSGGQLS
jgi:hypothetical protein